MNTSELQEVMTIDPDIVGGTPVFAGTRVPIKSLFDNLCGGLSIEEYLEDFPSVTRDQIHQVLNLANEGLKPEQSIY